MKKQTNKIKEWIDASPSITIIIAIAAILGCILGIFNSYFTLVDKLKEHSQNINVNFRGVFMSAEEEVLSHGKYARLYLGGPLFDNEVTESGPMDSTIVMNIPIEIRMINQKKDPTYVSQFQLFAQLWNNEWVSSSAFEVIDRSISSDSKANGIVELQPKQIKDIGLKFYFGPAKDLISLMKTETETTSLQNIYLVFRDEQGQTERINLW